MNILLTILLVIAGLIILLLIIALFTKKKYAIEREITINKPKPKVFEYVKYLKNQNNYAKWNLLDPDMKREYKGVDGTVGFLGAWDSENKKVGKGEQEIKNIVEGQRVDLALHFIKPFEGNADAYLITESINDNQTKVKWGLSSSMKYPMNIMLVLMGIENMLGKDLEEGLGNLKRVVEAPIP